MKYCTYCGRQIEDNALFCPNCGAKQEPSNESGTERSFFEENAFGDTNGGQSAFYANDPLVTERSRGITVLSFIFPIVGLILWLLWKDSKPGKSISAAKGGLAGASFNSPLIGLIVWLVCKDSNPELAKPCAIAALVGFVFAIFLGIVTVVLTIMGTMANPDLYAHIIGGVLNL